MVWLPMTDSLFIVWLFMVPVSCACTLFVLPLSVDMHTFKEGCERVLVVNYLPSLLLAFYVRRCEVLFSLL